MLLRSSWNLTTYWFAIPDACHKEVLVSHMVDEQGSLSYHRIMQRTWLRLDFLHTFHSCFGSSLQPRVSQQDKARHNNTNFSRVSINLLLVLSL
jgi:hypothetical protein